MDERPWWLFVLGIQEGVDWVMSQKRMAFVEYMCRRAAKIEPGDRAFIYQTKRLLGDVGRITAMAEITDTVKGETLKVGSGLHFSCWCPLRFLHTVNPHDGIALGPLVPSLKFIRRKELWSHYLRSAVVRLPPADGALLAQEFGSK